LESGANGGGSAQPDAEAFELLIGKIRDVVEAQVPAEAPFGVVSKGDAALGRIAADRVRHFPHDEQGAPSDVPPADGADAVAQVERLRAGGVEYLVFPSSSFGWLERFPELNEHLVTSYRLVASDNACLIYHLVEQAPAMVEEAPPPPPDPDLMAAVSDLLTRLVPPRSAIAVLTLSAGAPVPAGMQAWTFPRAARADLGLAAGPISALEAGGVEFLVIPAPEREWLELHPALLGHLRSRHRLVTSQGHLCDVYELEAPRTGGDGELPEAEPPERSAERGGSPVTRLVGTVLRTSVDGLVR
jgi:hypothetical protein